MSNYTFEDVKRVLHEVIAERPEYVYEYPEGANECTYTDKDGNPSCLIGQVIHRLDPEELAHIHADEWGKATACNEWGEEEEGTHWAPVYIVAVAELDWARQFDDHEKRALEIVQAEQDKQTPWGQAEEAMIHFLERDAN